MPCEALGEEEVVRGAVDVRHGRVAQRMEGVEPIEGRNLLPESEEHLETTRRDAPSRDTAEQWRERIEALAVFDLVLPESGELGSQGIGDEDVPRTTPLRDLRSNLDSLSWPPIREVEVSDVHADEFAQTQARPECEREHQVVPRVISGDTE